MKSDDQEETTNGKKTGSDGYFIEIRRLNGFQALKKVKVKNQC